MMKKMSSSAFAPAAFMAAFMAAVPAFATLTPSLPRGERTAQLPTLNGKTEICVIPTHLPQGLYSADDRALENDLCSMQPGQNVATCPKVYSTNPGVDFYSIPAGMTAQSVEQNNNCEAGKKIAKYKLSVSCSYTPSIIGYYHLSRLLGGAGRVPVAVLRTLDIDRHKDIANRALNIAAKTEGKDAIIYQTWSTVYSFLNKGKAFDKFKDMVFTDAIDQTYGASIRQVKERVLGDKDFYGELFTKAAKGESRAAAFRDRNPVMAKVKSASPASSLVSTSFSASNVQALLQMKDVSDMILMDHIMSQQDRFGNLDYGLRFAYLENGEMKFATQLSPQEVSSKRAVEVKAMLMRDNDCGVTKTNVARDEGLLSRVAHMDPVTYKNLLMLNRTADSAEVTTAFKQGMMMTNIDWNGYKGRPGVRTLLNEAATTLQARCRSGQLKLDLDLGTHFSGRQAQQNCEI
ncbi:MAG: hypothetical protein EOP05_05995 [Proteobacteria bacterium]|nr:MAG: hypothetical protein EOP05_05995 [Pseudomonadota bacterium]